jgi:sulfatase modifying factor 1
MIYHPSFQGETMQSKTLGIVMVLGATLLGCAGATPSADANSLAAAVSAPPKAADARVKALIERTLKQLVFLEGGTFDMGDWGGPSGLPYDSNRDSKPLHKVTLDSFSMMAYQVTYEDFDAFTDAVGEERVNMDSYGVKNRAPRRHASPNWYGAKAYCQWLGQKTGLAFDLATEAQWEYAARSRGQKYLYATSTGKIERGRNFPPEWQYGQPKPPVPDVGSYPPNFAGLYGMSEGATEWVSDWYDQDYYKKSPQKNPQGPESGTAKVKRGSSGVPAEAANMIFMRTKATSRTVHRKFTGNSDDDDPIPGYSSLPNNAVRCVVNSTTPVK